MCEVAEVGEGEGVEDSLAVEVTEISAWPQASRGLRLQVEGTWTSFSDPGSSGLVLALLESLVSFKVLHTTKVMATRSVQTACGSVYGKILKERKLYYTLTNVVYKKQ